MRPTPDRLRGTLFDWLRPALPGMRVLDLFAGTGALAIEALSQGAGTACFVEQNQILAAALKANLTRLKLAHCSAVHSGDFRAVLHELRSSFHLVLLDPPFADQLWRPALIALAQCKLLTVDAVIYLEWPSEQPAPIPVGCLHKQTRVGAVQGGLLLATRLPEALNACSER